MALPARQPSTRASGVWRIKPIDSVLQESGDERNSLRRTMGTLDLTTFGIAAIIGAGIFSLTGVAAATAAGPAIILSYVIAAIVSGLAALCYAELASTIPIAGSAYTYSYAVLGELIAWIIGWDLILEYGVGASAVAISWSGYLTDFFKSIGITLPAALTAGPFTAGHAGWINLPAVLVILFITALLIIGTQETSRVAIVMVGVKLAIVAFFIVVGATHINPSNWHNFTPFGTSGIFSGAALIFFAYIGFDQISTAAEEVRDPQRTMPRGIFYSLTICTLLYILVAGILTLVVPYTKLNNASPVAHAMIQTGINWAATVISIGAVAGLFTVLLVLLFGQSRILFAISRDGMLPGAFSRVHPSFRTPWVSTILVGLVVALAAGLTPIDVAAELTNIGTLAAFALISLAVLILRHTRPDLRRGFRVPFVNVTAPLSVVASLFLIKYLKLVTLERFVIWLAIGLVIYYLYSRRHSKLERDTPPAQQHQAVS